MKTKYQTSSFVSRMILLVHQFSDNVIIIPVHINIRIFLCCNKTKTYQGEYKKILPNRHLQKGGRCCMLHISIRKYIFKLRQGVVQSHQCLLRIFQTMNRKKVLMMGINRVSLSKVELFHFDLQVMMSLNIGNKSVQSIALLQELKKKKEKKKSFKEFILHFNINLEVSCKLFLII